VPTDPPRPADRRRRTGRGLRAALASLLVPGLGQLALRRRGKGAALVAVPVLITAGVVWAAHTHTVGELAGWALQPHVLTALMVANLVLLALRLYATFDAYADGVRPPAEPVLPLSTWGAIGTAVALVGLAIVTTAPHAAVGYYAAATEKMIDAVFDEGDREAADPLPDRVPPEEPDEVPQPPDDAREERTPAQEPREEPPEPVETPPPPENPWLEGGRITVALLGSDAGPGRGGDRIDSLLVATVAPDTGDAAIFSLDRYIADFPLPGRLADVYAAHCPFGPGWEYLNALYRCGHERVPEEFAALYPDADDPAAAAVADVLGELLGIAVPHYAMVDMAGFVGAVDALGGVEVELPEPLRVRMSPATPDSDWYTVDLPAGVQVLDGEEALAFARFRDQDGGDADRMRRQRCLVDSVVARAEIGAILLGYPAIAGAVEEHVTTSIPIAGLPDLLQVLPRIDHDRLVTVGFGPPDYRGWDHVPDAEAIQTRVRQVLTDPDAALEEGATLEAGGEVCR
jgi:LCP family protein required for cell wall assembly